MRRKSKKRAPLSVKDKTGIVHMALVDHELFRDVAREYRVGLVTVQRLVTKARAHPQFLAELVADRQLREEKRDEIATAVK